MSFNRVRHFVVTNHTLFFQYNYMTAGASYIDRTQNPQYSKPKYSKTAVSKTTVLKNRSLKNCSTQKPQYSKSAVL